jgi:hypothetical protein
MSHRPIIDAGPSLNFFSINKERLLVGVLGPLTAPETVQAEVLRKSRDDERFHAATTVWRKLAPRWIQILPDDETPELAAVVYRVTRQPMEERLKHPKDLGETMVIAHAVVAAEAGETGDCAHRRRARGTARHLRDPPTATAPLEWSCCGVDQTGEHADGPRTRSRR